MYVGVPSERSSTKSSISSFATVTSPCTRSAMVVAPALSTFSRTTAGELGAAAGSASRQGLSRRKGRLAALAASRWAVRSSGVR